MNAAMQQLSNDGVYPRPKTSLFHIDLIHILPHNHQHFCGYHRLHCKAGCCKGGGDALGRETGNALALHVSIDLFLLERGKIYGG